MLDIQLGIKERAALLALMAEARELSNSELEEITGFRLAGAQRKKLNDAKLVETDTGVRPFVHSLTDNGWAWCANELSTSVPKGAGSAGGALYALLAGLDRYLRRSNQRLADVFQRGVQPSTETDTDIESRIRAAYRKLRKEPRAWVSLTRLRPLLTDFSKHQVDTTLQLMNRERDVNIVPQSNQKVLSSDDQLATVRIGNEDRLLLSIDEP